MKALGREATALTKSLVDEKQIRLEFDPNNAYNAYIGHRDKYRRILAMSICWTEPFSTLRLVSKVMGSPIPASPLNTWRISGDMRGRRGRVEGYSGGIK